ncbi:MAG: hypothetical protein DMF87_15575 [Acidobacteria bacterium]|nr:MAG: hypothetical protein DMF87_15575 [Acidobacteriota bacterium]
MRRLPETSQSRKTLTLPIDKPIVLASFGGYELPGLETGALAKFKEYTIVTTANLPLGRAQGDADRGAQRVVHQRERGGDV